MPRKKTQRGYRYSPETVWHEVKPGELLPREFSGTIDDPDLPYLIDLAVATEPGRVWCTSVTARARDESAPVTSEGLRKIPITTLVRRACDAVARAVYKYGFGVTRPDKYGVMRLTPDDPEGLASARDEVLRATGTRRELTPEFLKEVAAVWRSAPDPRARTKHVAEHFGTVRENARKWVRAVQDAGLISEDERMGKGRKR